MYTIEEQQNKMKLYHTLLKYCKWGYNWNYNGALPFSEQVIRNCSNLVDVLKGTWDIFPLTENNIQFEKEEDIKDEDGNPMIFYSEIEVYKNRIEILKMICDSDKRINSNFVEAVKVIKIKEFKKDWLDELGKYLDIYDWRNVYSEEIKRERGLRRTMNLYDEICDIDKDIDKDDLL